MEDPKATLTKSVERMLAVQEAIRKAAQEIRKERDAKEAKNAPEA